MRLPAPNRTNGAGNLMIDGESAGKAGESGCRPTGGPPVAARPAVAAGWLCRGKAVWPHPREMTALTTPTEQKPGPRRLTALEPPECLRLLGAVALGRIVFTAGGLPAIRPVNHLLV